MERVMSVEDKIRRAEEIYNRRREKEYKSTTRVRVENSEGRTNKSLNTRLKKMIIQISICLIIYLTFYYTINNNYIFSEELKNKCQEILSYDISFNEMYKKCSDIFLIFQTKYNEFIIKTKDENTEDTNNSNINETEETNNSVENNNSEQQIQDDNVDNQQNISYTEINQSLEGNLDTEINAIPEQTTNNRENVSNLDSNIGGTVEQLENTEETGETEELSEDEQMKKDAEDIKAKVSFVKPLEGRITSVFGWRNPKVSTVSKYHTGIDIAANQGTDIISATNGKVIVSSSKGAYGNHLKIQIEDVIMVYAHCLDLNVNEGDEISQGQKIARVGSTGNSTGPHLHFEIRKDDRYVDPKLIIDF